MVLSEQVRQMASEERLINDTTNRGRSFARSWDTLYNYGNIVLSSATLIVFRFTIVTSGYNLRLKIGNYYVWGKNNVSVGTISGIAFISAGTHAVVLEDSGTPSSEINPFQLGKAKFTDEIGEALAAYSSTINKTVSPRTTCIGALSYAVFMVRCWAQTIGGQTNFENPGDSLTNGVSLLVDGVQVAWINRDQDAGSKENASAYWYGSLSVSVSHSFEISKDNADTTVHITVYASPWLLHGSPHEPVTLDFSPQSTLYLLLEPLNENPTKNVKVGKTRVVSFGDSTDFYNSASGTGLLAYDYTFEILKIGETPLFVDGLGGCIGVIAVDPR